MSHRTAARLVTAAQHAADRVRRSHRSEQGQGTVECAGLAMAIGVLLLAVGSYRRQGSWHRRDRHRRDQDGRAARHGKFQVGRSASRPSGVAAVRSRRHLSWQRGTCQGPACARDRQKVVSLLAMRTTLYALGGLAIVTIFIVRQRRSDRYRDRSLILPLVLGLYGLALLRGTWRHDRLTLASILLLCLSALASVAFGVFRGGRSTCSSARGSCGAGVVADDRRRMGRLARHPDRPDRARGGARRALAASPTWSRS